MSWAYTAAPAVGGDLLGPLDSATVQSVTRTELSVSLTADTDDLEIPGLVDSAVVRLLPVGDSWSLSGLLPPDPDKTIAATLLNPDPALSVVLRHNAGSAVGNRFLGPGQVDYTLAPQQAVQVLRDPADQVWRLQGAA